MSKALSIACFLALAVLGGALTLTCIRPPDGHYDFNLRMNELACVRLGVNPYAVWHGDAELKPFYANTHKGPVPEGCTKQVNAYAPWAYVYMLPVSLLPEGAEWPVYCLLMALCVVGIAMMTARKDASGAGRTTELAVPLLLIGYPLFANCSVGNFGVLVLFGAVLMAWALNSWTYASNYCQAMGWFLAFALVRELVRTPRSKFLWTMLALSAFFLSRWVLAWHGLCSFAGWRFPMSEYAFRCVDSLNSTVSLVLAAMFCVWKGRRICR